jgi:hypothetical protein
VRQKFHLKDCYPGDEFYAPSGKHYILMAGDRTAFTGVGHDFKRTALVMRVDDFTVHGLPWSIRIDEVPIQYRRFFK